MLKMVYNNLLRYLRYKNFKILWYRRKEIVQIHLQVPVISQSMKKITY